LKVLLTRYVWAGWTGLEKGESTRISKILDTCSGTQAEMGAKKVQKGASVAQALVQVSGPATVEDALADALSEASKAQRWDVVAMLAKELEARRLAGAQGATSNVVSISDAKRGVK
jgi:hypothetical protein